MQGAVPHRMTPMQGAVPHRMTSQLGLHVVVVGPYWFILANLTASAVGP